MKNIQDLKNGLKTFCVPGPSCISSPNCLSVQRRKPSLRKKRKFTQGQLTHKTWRQTYDFQFQVHCSFNFPRSDPKAPTLFCHTSARGLIYSCLIMSHLCLKIFNSSMALQVNRQLLILTCETLPTGVFPPYMHAPQPSTAPSSQHTSIYMHTLLSSSQKEWENMRPSGERIQQQSYSEKGQFHIR